MMPIYFGGNDSEANTLYVPEFIKTIKDTINQRLYLTL